jgi:hypothetical protein
VGQDAILPYRIGCFVGQDAILPYRIGCFVGQDAILPYRIGRFVGQDAILPYRIGCFVGQDAILPYKRELEFLVDDVFVPLFHQVLVAQFILGHRFQQVARLGRALHRHTAVEFV